MRHVQSGGRTVDRHNLVAPVNLIGFARIEDQRDEGMGSSFSTNEYAHCGAKNVNHNQTFAKLMAEGSEPRFLLFSATSSASPLSKA